MTTIKATPVTIKLGNLELDACQLPDGSYARQGLFRLSDTDIYLYDECWYCLNPDILPILEDLDVWDWDRCLCFEGNRLSYLSVDLIDPEGGWDENNLVRTYVPVASGVGDVMAFVIKSRITSDEVMLRLRRDYELSLSGNSLSRALHSQCLLRDTEMTLLKLGLGECDMDVSSTPKRPASNTPKPRVGFVYLVKMDAHLKLGFTQDLNKRLKAFETTNASVDLIKSVKGTLCKEKRLHAMLGSKVRELYDFEDEQRIIEAMDSINKC